MSEILKFLYERATDPLGLPINSVYEYIILAVIDFIAYKMAYDKVGDMYHDGWIDGKVAGSFFHWLIRVLLFVAVWFVVYSIIQVFFFVMANWHIVLMIVSSIACTAILCVLAVFIMRMIRKRMTANNNV